MTAFAEVTQPITFKEADEADIAQLIFGFADGAARAVEAGFDAIELHGGHTYIIAPFLSPANNRRTDRLRRFGRRPRAADEGSDRGVRARIGPDFPVRVKLDSRNIFFDGGITLEDARSPRGLPRRPGPTPSRSPPATITRFRAHCSPRACRMMPNKLLPLCRAQFARRRSRSGHHRRPGRSRGGRHGDRRGQARFPRPGPQADCRRCLSPTTSPRAARSAVRPCIFCYQCLSQSMTGPAAALRGQCRCRLRKGRSARPGASPRRSWWSAAVRAGWKRRAALTLRGHQVTLLEAWDSLAARRGSRRLLMRPTATSSNG